MENSQLVWKLISVTNLIPVLCRIYEDPLHLLAWSQRKLRKDRTQLILSRSDRNTSTVQREREVVQTKVIILQPLLQAMDTRVVAARVLSVILLMAQGALLNVFLIRDRSSSNYAWITCDCVTLLVWIILLVKPRFHRLLYQAVRQGFSQCRCCTRPRDAVDGQLHELRSMWLSWLVYSCASVGPRIGVIYYSLAPDMRVDMNFGANLLKVTLMMTAALFLCLVAAHNGPEAYTYDKFYLERVQSGAVLDILDTGEVLDVFFTEERRSEGGEEFIVTQSLAISILVFAILNLVLPTLALMEMEKKRKKQYKYNMGASLWTNAKLWYVIMNTLAVNVPFAVLRIVLWAKHDRHVSVLLVKNIIYIVLNVLDLVEYFGKEGPVRCPQCKLLYPHNRLEKHQHKHCTNQRPSLTSADAGVRERHRLESVTRDELLPRQHAPVEVTTSHETGV